MYKSFLLSLFAVMAVTAVAATYPASYYTLAPETSSVVGDVNNDGSVTSVDVTALYNYLLNGDSSSIIYGDQDGDNKITAGDITVIYNTMLNGNSGTQVTSITMKEYQDINSTTSVNHQWRGADETALGDVIYITLDGVEQNMYVLTRNGGKWVLLDIAGSNKAGFKASGTIKAMWVRGGAWWNEEVYDITVPHDYAIGSGSYTLNGTTVSINLNLSLAESKVLLTGPYSGQIKYMTYCHRVNKVYDINGLCDGQMGEFILGAESQVRLTELPEGMVALGTFDDISAQGNTLYHATTSSGRSWMREGSSKIQAGQSISFVNPEYSTTGWVRDFAMSYYDYDETQTRQRVYPDVTKTIHMLVGTEITFAPQEGSVADNGTTITRSSTNTNVVTASASANYNSTTIKACGVGNAYVTFTYKNSLGEEFDFYVRVYVDPAVWLAGSRNGTPVLYRNTTLKYSNFDVSATAIDQVFVRKGTAYIRTYDSNNPNGAPYIMRSTNPVYYGSFIQRLHTAMTHFLVTKEGDMWYTNGTNVYKNNNLAFARPSGSTITDLKQDESSGSNYVWISGYTSANPAEASINDVAWLYSNLGGIGSVNAYSFPSDRVTTALGGYQPNGATYTGPRSPHFGKISIQYGFVLINGYDVEEHGYRDYYGQIQESYYNYKKTYTYDSSNGFLRQNNVDYPGDFFFENQSTERVFFNNNGVLCYHNLRNNDVSIVNTSLPSISVLRYVSGIIYAYGNGKLMIGTPLQFFQGTYKTITISGSPSINDIFVETTLN